MLNEADELTIFLRGTLAPYWPELYGKLGERAGDFIEAARRKARMHQLRRDESVARYINLCCAFGPNFENKPENEWALAVLANDRLDEWVRVHQLVVRSEAELRRRPGGGGAATQLALSDGVLIDAHDLRHSTTDSDAVALPRIACDLDAVDIRVMENEWRREYRPLDGTWQLAPTLSIVTSVRMGPGQSAPAQICVLTHAPKVGPVARLQVRLLTHSVCDGDRHPLVSLAGAHGLTQWHGHSARAVSWDVHASPATRGPNGVGDVFLVEETFPDAALLRVASCGLRDEGVPTGPLQTYVWAYLADQWLFTLHRVPGQELNWPNPARKVSDAPSEATARCRIERDGVAVACGLWETGFQKDLSRQISAGFEMLFNSWEASTKDSSMKVGVDLLVGKAALTWGWHEGQDGLVGKPVMRAVGDFDLNNSINLELCGEVEVGTTRTRLRLSVRGEAPMKQLFARERAVPALMDVLLQTKVQWKMEFKLEFDPLAVEDASLWKEAGPCTGSLSGEVGLRPRQSGSGWQWYAQLSTEPVSVPLCIFDPLLGQTHQTLHLLPAVSLLNWSLG